VEVQRLLGDEVLPTEPHQRTLSEVFRRRRHGFLQRRCDREGRVPVLLQKVDEDSCGRLWGMSTWLSSFFDCERDTCLRVQVGLYVGAYLCSASAHNV
jgi:hypothetical protein